MFCMAGLCVKRRARTRQRSILGVGELIWFLIVQLTALPSMRVRGQRCKGWGSTNAPEKSERCGVKVRGSTLFWARVAFPCRRFEVGFGVGCRFWTRCTEGIENTFRLFGRTS